MRVEICGKEWNQNCSFFVVKLLTKFSRVLAVVCHGDLKNFSTGGALDFANPLQMYGGVELRFPGRLGSGILCRLVGKWLFHPATEDRIADIMLFDKEVSVVIAHHVRLV
jgi:hypothetical protein